MLNENGSWNIEETFRPKSCALSFLMVFNNTLNIKVVEEFLSYCSLFSGILVLKAFATLKARGDF
jgi:hypothetical protein